MDDKTKKILKNTGLFAAAVGITAAKAVKWSAEQVWEHIAILDNNGIAVNELQMKATDSVDYIKTALERYPDIDIVTTEEVYNSVVMHEFADSVINSGISNEELTSVVTEALESDSVDMDWGLPVIPMLLIGYSVYKKESLSSFEKGTEFGDRYIQSYISYIAGGAVAVITNTWWLGLIASMGTKVFCKYGRVKFNKAKSLDRTISLNEKILKKMREKLKYAYG